MTTAIIGIGNIGKSGARHLVDGGERVVLAAHNESGGSEEASEDWKTAHDRPHEPSGDIAGDAYGDLIAGRNA